MREKMILWRSDLWYGTLTFGAIALFCFLVLGIHAAAGESGEAFTMGLVAVIPTVLALFCAFTDRSEAMDRIEIFPDPDVAEESRRWAARIEEDLAERSYLNPKNNDRLARALDKDRDPDIG